MRAIRVLNESRGTVLIERGGLARSWKERLVGLMGRKKLGPGDGLVIRPCESIHTCWMRFPIDVIFTDVEDRVVRLFPAVPPWRMKIGGRGADTVIEVPPGTIAASGTERGDRIGIVEE